MTIKTKLFQDAANKILFAAGLDENAANLEVVVKGEFLYLNVTNKEYYVSVKFPLEQPEEFRAVVDASLFLNLISGLTVEEFSLAIKDNAVVVTAGKSNYKLAMIYDNDKLMSLPPIFVENPTVEMTISNDILDSILNVNSKELLKVKKIDVNELQKLYYVDETGCFTFTTGACLNSFTLEKPIKLLLNDRIVKLFKLFDEDVAFKFGHETLPDGNIRSKAAFQTSSVYMAAILTCDELLLSKIQGPCNATKRYVTAAYPNHVVVSANALAAAISRLMLFTKNSVEKANMSYIPATVTITVDDITIQDKQDNVEVVPVENDTVIQDDVYTLKLNLFDLKFALDSCKNEHITINCGNGKSIVIGHGAISHLISEIGK